MNNKAKRSLNVVPLALRYTNDEITDLMRRLKLAREKDGKSPVTCVMDGFNDDRRELGEIPEVRAFCRRLVDTGFISWLDVSTTVPELTSPSLAGFGGAAGLGAFEVWSIAEGWAGKAGTYTIPTERLVQFLDVLKDADQKADERLGDD